MRNYIFAFDRGLRVLLALSALLLAALPFPVGAQDMMASGVFASIRHYAGVDPAKMDMTMEEIARITSRDFVPILRELEGFIGYYWVYTDEDALAAINIFETRDQALASNELARDYVVENFAELVSGPPLIVDGPVDISFIEMLDGLSDADVSSLFASLRIYDGFEMDNLAEFVSTVEDGFLPLMRETDGFFGYYLMNNGAGTVAAISLFDTEASALASNEKARDFVAENLAGFLPSPPLTTSGRAGIAVLTGANGDANLLADNRVFASARLYDGVDPADQPEIARLADEGFLPILRESDGFIGYYLLPAGDMLAAISLFDSAEQASASTEAAREYVAENLAPLLPNPPRIVEGTAGLNYVAALGLDEMIPTALYASMRVYEGFNMQYIDEANALAETHLIPVLQEAKRFFAQYTIDDSADTVVAISIYESEEVALAANDSAAAFTREHIAQWLPDDPIRIGGQLGVAALADMRDGANLIGG